MKTRIITAAFASLAVGAFTAGNVAMADEATAPRGEGVAVPAAGAAGEVAAPRNDADPSLTERAGQAIDDAALLTRVKTAMLRSDDVKGLDVNVDVKDGHVTLSGKTESVAQRSAAEQIARTTSGVQGVDNKLTLE